MQASRLRDETRADDAACIACLDFRVRGKIGAHDFLTGCPPDIVVAADVAECGVEPGNAVQAPRMREILDAGGFVAVANTPDEFRAFVRAEIKRYEQIVLDANVKVE